MRRVSTAEVPPVSVPAVITFTSHMHASSLTATFLYRTRGGANFLLVEVGVASQAAERSILKVSAILSAVTSQGWEGGED